jgi:formiminotetrahydrofolate cyclodeaminase
MANLSHPKRGFEERREALEKLAERGQALKDRLLAAVDADTAAFDVYLAALRLPQGTPDEKAVREKAMVEATVGTIEVPMITLEAAPGIVELCREAGEIGMAASLSDAGTGAAMALAAASGAYQNVCINLPGLSDPQARAALLARADAAWEKTKALAARAESDLLGRLRAAAV